MLSPEAIIAVVAVIITLPTTLWCLWRWCGQRSRVLKHSSRGDQRWVALADLVRYAEPRQAAGNIDKLPGRSMSSSTAHALQNADDGASFPLEEHDIDGSYARERDLAIGRKRNRQWTWGTQRRGGWKGKGNHTGRWDAGSGPRWLRFGTTTTVAWAVVQG